MLLVPYYSWKTTHRRHHQNTGSVENDEVFVPTTRSELSKEVKHVGGISVKELVEVTPIYAALNLAVILTVGWLPGYLVFNGSGPRKYAGKSKSHFNPWAAFFTEKQVGSVILSDIGFFAAVAAILHCAGVFGWAAVFKFYAVPFFIVNMHLVTITYLQVKS